jgi:hypothetical protein
VRKPDPVTSRPVSGRLRIPRLGWVSTGTGGGTGEGAGERVIDEEEVEGDGGAVMAAALVTEESS